MAAAVALGYPVVTEQLVRVVFLEDGRYRKALNGEQGIGVITSQPEIDANGFLTLQRQHGARALALAVRS